VNHLASWFGKATHSALDAAIPRTCAACEQWIASQAGPLCSDCRAAIHELRRRPSCPRCGRTAAPDTVYDGGCGLCRREQFWNVRGIARIGPYEGPLRTLVLLLKFGREAGSAELLGKMLAEALQAQHWPGAIDCLVPVPMHWLRRWQRPTDHARELATAISHELHIPVRALVHRAQYSRSQAELNTSHARFENVSGCFRPRRRANLAGKTVCIVDNLATSGATLHEVSKVLRRCGARTIYAAVACRSLSSADHAGAGNPAAAGGSLASPFAATMRE
jgi:ComF family protein